MRRILRGPRGPISKVPIPLDWTALRNIHKDPLLRSATCVSSKYSHYGSAYIEGGTRRTRTACIGQRQRRGLRSWGEIGDSMRSRTRRVWRNGT